MTTNPANTTTQAPPAGSNTVGLTVIAGACGSGKTTVAASTIAASLGAFIGTASPKAYSIEDPLEYHMAPFSGMTPEDVERCCIEIIPAADSSLFAVAAILGGEPPTRHIDPDTVIVFVARNLREGLSAPGAYLGMPVGKEKFLGLEGPCRTRSLMDSDGSIRESILLQRPSALDETDAVILSKHLATGSATPPSGSV